MTDKKSVVVVLGGTANASAKFEAEEGVSYRYEIGEHNGVLIIVKLSAVDSMLSIPDEEEVVVCYGSGEWCRVYYE